MNHWSVNTKELEKAEESARKQGIGIWKKSQSSDCIQLIKLTYQEKKRCNNEEQLILNNKCTPINAVLKDDSGIGRAQAMMVKDALGTNSFVKVTDLKTHK